MKKMIRKLILRFLITAVAVAAVIYAVPGIVFTGSLVTLLKIVSVFFAANLLLKPLVMIFMLPVEIATLGIMSILLNSALLFGAAHFFPGFKISSFWFSGLSGSSFVIAPLEIPAFLTALLGAFLIGLVSTILYWLTK